MYKVTLAQTGKMPCASWSLQAVETCPGAWDSNGGLVAACQGCYATTGRYLMEMAKRPRRQNKQDWQHPMFVPAFIDELNRPVLSGKRAGAPAHPLFRWFDSGDMYDLRLAEKLYRIMLGTPNTRHWLPTRMWKFPKFDEVISRMEALSNVVVRRSSDSITGGRVPGRNTSTIIPTSDTEVPAHVSVCGAYQRDGKCGECRACWDKDVAVIAYPAHGQVMQKLVAKSAQIPLFKGATATKRIILQEVA